VIVEYVGHEREKFLIKKAMSLSFAMNQATNIGGRESQELGKQKNNTSPRKKEHYINLEGRAVF